MSKAKKLIDDEKLGDRHHGCWRFFKHHKIGAIILFVAIIVVVIAVTAITCYCVSILTRELTFHNLH